MKPFIKAFTFLGLLTILDVVFRKGFAAHFLGFLPPAINITLLFTLFAVTALLLTKRVAQLDQMSLSGLGISLSKPNSRDFLLGFVVGVVLWGIVSISQSLIAGFFWELRPDFNPLTLLHGLLFIFIADLGTELYTRGYPLTKLEQGFGAKLAIAIMVVFEVIKGFVYNPMGDLFIYAMGIPVLHIIFFSFIYFKTRRLGASLGIHTGANFITISIFDLRVEQAHQAIPAGLFQANVDLEQLSMNALQMPWVIMAMLFCIATYFWWSGSKTNK